MINIKAYGKGKELICKLLFIGASVYLHSKYIMLNLMYYIYKNPGKSYITFAG